MALIRPLLFLVAGLAALASCARPQVTVGGACEINSDCAAPFVCVIGSCRRQCDAARDCGAGLQCIVVSGSSVGGGCQLPEEASCTLTSECHSPALVCQNATCTTPCREDRDCATGAHCVLDAASMQSACYDDAIEPCVYNSDCPTPMICDRDQTCRLECITDRDCTAPRSCVANLCELPDATLGSDGGP